MIPADTVARLFVDLPEDDNAAFVKFHGRLLDLLGFVSARGFEDESAMAEYATHLYAFAKNYDIDLILPINKAPPFANVEQWVWPNLHAAEIFCAEIIQAQMRPPRPDPGKSIEFGLEEKAKIRGYLDRIRSCVDHSDWTQSKKDDVHSKITALQEATEKSRTRMEAFLSSWLDITNGIGEGADNMEPAINALERILKAAGKARSQNQQMQIEGPEEQKQLPAPDSQDE